MAWVPVSAEDSEYIAACVAAFPGEAPGQLRWLAPYVEEFAALPLYIGWTETVGLRADGEVICWSTEREYAGARPVEDPVWVRAGLVEGAKRFPGLRGLIPARPPDARTCPVCGGAGYPLGLPQVGCSCGGVGWVDAADSA
jgi:hypothetical protein